MKNLNKILIAVLVFSIFISTAAYATIYKLRKDKISDRPEIYFKDKLANNILRGSVETSCMQWEENGSRYGVPLISAGISSTFSEKYSINSFYDDDCSDCYAATIFFNNGDIMVSLNTGTVSLNNEIDNIKTWHFIINHEIGHCFGLDDLKPWDSRNSVMSYYANKAKVERPTENDYEGVKAAYN